MIKSCFAQNPQTPWLGDDEFSSLSQTAILLTDLRRCCASTSRITGWGWLQNILTRSPSCITMASFFPSYVLERCPVDHLRCRSELIRQQLRAIGAMLTMVSISLVLGVKETAKNPCAPRQSTPEHLGFHPSGDMLMVLTTTRYLFTGMAYPQANQQEYGNVFQELCVCVQERVGCER